MTWIKGVTKCETSNQSSREGYQVAGVVLHYTAGSSAEGSLRWMCTPKAPSAHLLIGRDGNVTQLVSLDRKAWHAGNSVWMYHGSEVEDCNRYTIGIELDNLGLVQGSPEKGWQYYINGAAFRYPGRLELPVYRALDLPNGQQVAGWWEPYQEDQINSLRDILLAIEDEYGPLPIIGHSDIARPVGNKIDPGGAFDWRWVAFEDACSEILV